MDTSSSSNVDASLVGLVSAAENLCVRPTTALSRGVRSMDHLECAAYGTDTAVDSCTRSGLHLCSQCRMLKYCSKACQTAHWPKHKHDCKSPYLKSSWTTNWALQGRTPDFITDSDPGHEAPGFGHTLHYVWGNLPAMDCLNAANNERDSVSTKNLNLAFVASGDLRNVMATVNALPADYNGRCNILMNDLDTTVAGRNAALLFILLSDSGLELEEAAELCLHLQYSAALTREQAAQAFSCLATLFSNSLSHPTRQTCFKEIPLRGGGTLHLSFAETSIILDMIASRYPLSEAIRNMHAIVLAPTRKDYLDRYLFALRGPHRLGDMHLRKTGVLLPFGVSTSEFTEPNRLLFTSEGRWLSLDSASQLSGWDPRQVVATGKKHGCPEEDINGCLFFHVKDVFTQFAKRAQHFRLNMHVTNTDALILPTLIENGYGSLHLLPVASFDRIETSNVMDYVGVDPLVCAWAPMLNRENSHATLLLSTMNWVLQSKEARAFSLAGKRGGLAPLLQKSATYLDTDLRSVAMSRGSNSDPKFVNVLQHLDSFHDSSEAFRAHVEEIGLNDVPKRYGLALQATNTVIPKGIAWPLSSRPKTMPPYSKEDWYLLSCLGRVHGTERFLELRAV